MSTAQKTDTDHTQIPMEFALEANKPKTYFPLRFCADLGLACWERRGDACGLGDTGRLGDTDTGRLGESLPELLLLTLCCSRLERKQ